MVNNFEKYIFPSWKLSLEAWSVHIALQPTGPLHWESAICFDFSEHSAKENANDITKKLENHH